MCTCTGKHQAKKGGSEGPSWEQERGEGEGIAMEGSGQRTRTGTSQHLQDPVALLPPARCARQPLTPSVAAQGRGCGQVVFIHMQRHPSACQVPRERLRLESTSTVDLLAGFNINA